MISPARAGPITKASSPALVFQVAALVNTSSGTVCERNAELVGLLNARAVPMPNRQT